MPFQVFSRFLGVLGVSWDPMVPRLGVWWVVSVEFFDGEFDPGSGRTLAACLTHASRTLKLGACTGWMSGERVSNT